MAAPTSIEVSLSDTEYSRYEPGKDTIVATVTVTGGAPYASEEVLVELVKARRARDAVVASATVSITGATDPQSAEVEFYLPDILDQDLISLVRRGLYFVRATSVTDDSIIGESVDVPLRLMTVSKFRNDYLYGFNLQATDVRYVKLQPASITGVEVTEVSRGHGQGFFSLSYTYRVDGATTIRQLSWNGGPLVSITAPGTFILRSGNGGTPSCSIPFGGNDYIVVKVKALSALPTTSVTEDLLVEERKMDDTAIAGFLDKAISWVENDLLCVYLEPTNVVTERDPTTYQFTAGAGAPVPLFTDSDYDVIASPLTYFLPKTGTWVTINTPHYQLLRVDSLYGAVANTRVIDIDLDWVQIGQQGGMIQLVPFNQEVAFNFLGLIWNNAMRGAAELPNFWHYNLIAGLRDCPPDVLEFVAKKAAVEVFTIAGAALRPGLGSVSLSRDGVSESVSYANAKYGNFTGIIQAYKDYLDEQTPKFRAKYRGASMVVV